MMGFILIRPSVETGAYNYLIRCSCGVVRVFYEDPFETRKVIPIISYYTRKILRVIPEFTEGDWFCKEHWGCTS